MSTLASAPLPSASILAKESLVCAASPAWPLEPTQIAPDSLTIGISAEANPPAIGSSVFARATRLETTTTLTGRSPGWCVRLTDSAPVGSGCAANAAKMPRKRFEFRFFSTILIRNARYLANNATNSAPATNPVTFSGFSVSRRGQQADFGVARIKTRMLHDNRNVRLEDRRIIGVARNRRGIFEVVEAKMQRAPRRHGDAIRSDRLAIGKKYRDAHMRVVIGRIQYAGGFVRDQSTVRK